MEVEKSIEPQVFLQNINSHLNWPRSMSLTEGAEVK